MGYIKLNLPIVSLALLLALLPNAALGASNDWTVPCHSGTCSYENEFASVTIKGPPNSISDVTDAAGWTIVDCDPHAIEQSIRLVCHADSDGEGCNSLNLEKSGNQVVRLPESCGKGPFVRVSKAWVAEDQRVPDAVAKKLAKRSRRGRVPKVMSMKLDTKFEEMDPAETGDITFEIRGFNVPGLTKRSGLADSPSSSGNSTSTLLRRGLKKDFDLDDTTSLPPITVSQSFPLFSQSISCTDPDGSPISASASVKATLNAAATANVKVGVVASGTVFPPKVKEFAMVVGMDAVFDGNLEVVGDAQGKVDSGKVNLLTIPIGGISIDGILDVGPSFKLAAQAVAQLDIKATAKVGLSYNVNGVQFEFPKNDNTATGFGPADQILSLYVTPSVASKASVSAHLIPSLNFGLKIFGTGANVFVNLDASSTAEVTLNAIARAETSTTVHTGSTKAPVSASSSSVLASPSTSEVGETTVTSSSAEATGASESTSAGMPTGAESSSNADSPAETEPADNDSSPSTDTSAPPATSTTVPSTSNAVSLDSGSSSADPNTEQAPVPSSITRAPSTSTAILVAPPPVPTTTSPATCKPRPKHKKRKDHHQHQHQHHAMSKRVSTSSSVDGCVDVFTQLDVNVGADASFFGIFDESTSFNLFSKKFEMFKKCFTQANSQAPSQKRAPLPLKRFNRTHPQRFSRFSRFSPARVEPIFAKRDLTCIPTPASGPLADLVALIDSTISSSDISSI